MSSRIAWSRKSLDELAAFYWSDVAGDLERLGHDPQERPGYDLLREAGYSGLARALRRDHDQTLTSFFEEVVGLDDPDESGDYWTFVTDERTREALRSYVAAQRRRSKRRESTVRSKRSRLRRYVETYADVHGTDDLISPLAEPASQPAEIERAETVLDRLDDELSTDNSKFQLLYDVRGFYDRLVDRSRATYNPLASTDYEDGWQREDPENPALSAEQVRRLHDAAATREERLVVVGLAGWGLRPDELVGLHVSQVELADEPYLSFESRKNGPGEVNVVFGLDALAERVDELSSEDWNGYLFPSARSETGHLSRNTLRWRFKSVADRAGVTVDGATATPKHARRFWYTTYTGAVAALAAQVRQVAADQGSADPEVVMRKYVPDGKLRSYRRGMMRDALEEAFEEPSG